MFWSPRNITVVTFFDGYQSHLYLTFETTQAQKIKKVGAKERQRIRCPTTTIKKTESARHKEQNTKYHFIIIKKHQKVGPRFFIVFA